MQKIKSERAAKAVKYIDEWLDFNYRDSRLPGISVAIQLGDKLLLNKSYGYADSTRKIKLTPEHIFRIASHSKTFTATAIFQLYEAGKLRLDDKISEHLEWFKSEVDSEVEKITIRHFLNHTSGLIRDGVDSNYWQLDREFPDKKELKEFIKNSKLHTLKISEHFKYSNFGYSYLGLLIEKVSGKTYDDYISEYIFKKLNLQTTYTDFDESFKEKLAVGHTPMLFNNQHQLVEHGATNGMAAATGFCSTAKDLCTYFAAHFYGNDTLISDTSKREMQHGYWPTENSDESYGLGMAVYYLGKNTLYGHGGGFPGFITNTRFEPVQKLVITVLTNAWDGPAGLISRRIFNIFDYFNTNDGKVKNGDKYEGRFFCPWYVTNIVNVNGKVLSVLPRNWNDFSGDNAETLEVINDTVLKIEHKNSYGSSGEEVEYEFDEKGKVKSLRISGTEMLPEKEYLKKMNIYL